MSFYDSSSAWSAPGRQPSWEQQAPSRSGIVIPVEFRRVSDGTTHSDGDCLISGASSTVQRDEQNAFAAQFEEVDRAADNLVKSGKWLGTPGRRDPMPAMGSRQFHDYDARMGGSPRHHSGSDYDGTRSHSASNLQNYYANQRFQPRHNDADQMMQAKRRMAAQRERELRNYHQEQQYNRSVVADVAGPKSDRSMSPNAMTDDERRELLARQHRALYGNDSSLYSDRPVSQDARVTAGVAGVHGNSPLAYDPFSMQAQVSSAESAVQMPAREQMQNKDSSAGAEQSRANSSSSPSSNPTNFSMFENAQQSSRTSNSSPGGSPPRQGAKGAGPTGVAPIGTRPAQAQAPVGNGAVNKRSTTPLPSPLSYGFTAAEQNSNNNERTTSVASSNPSASVVDKGVGLGWGSNSGVWGASKNTLGVQTSVWG